MTTNEDRIVWESDEEALYRAARAQIVTHSASTGREAPRNAATPPSPSMADSARELAERDATVAKLRAEVERLETLLSTMDHFAEVAETCERKSNEWAAKLRAHELANGGCVPAPAYADLAKAYQTAEAKVAAVEALAESKGAWKGAKHVRITERLTGYEVTRSAIWVDDLRAALASVGLTEPAPEVGAADTQDEGAGDGVFASQIFRYSEWLDSQGLIVSDLPNDGSEVDKRTHEDLAREFLAAEGREG